MPFKQAEKKKKELNRTPRINLIIILFLLIEPTGKTSCSYDLHKVDADIMFIFKILNSSATKKEKNLFG